MARVCEHFPEVNPARDMSVLSIGAGDVEKNVDMSSDPNADWGLQQWACVACSTTTLRCVAATTTAPAN
jgi:hypothetical protein